jgi:hypothetical protein
LLADGHRARRGLGRDEKAQRDRARDLRRGPAAQALQLGEIHAVAVKAEAKNEHRYQDARQNSAPAGIARGRLVVAVWLD